MPVAFLALSVGLAAWALRWLVGAGIPPGRDITGHLQRIDFAIDSLFTRGLLDGWFPGAMLGYQEFLLYGPGLALLVAVARLATFGLLSSAGALMAVLVASYAAVPWATARLARAFGLGWRPAGAAGLLALAASSTRGGGIAGAFDMGLAAQQVAVPLLVLALALLVECGRGASARPRRLALVVAALAVTHPYSLALLVMLGPLVLVAAWAGGQVGSRPLRSLSTAAGWSVGLSAAWWLPALVHRDLRGPVTSWDPTGLVQHLVLLVNGERGWHGLAGPVVASGVASALLVGVVRRQRGLAALGALPLAGLATVHLARSILDGHDALGRQIPDRGLVLVALLGAPAAGWMIDRGAAFLAPGRGASVWTVAAGVALISIGGQRPPASSWQRPSQDLRAVAAVLAAEVPDGARFAYIAGDDGALGVPEPGRWLAWSSGRWSLFPFGPEYAPGGGPAMAAVRPPGVGRVGSWLERLRDLGVTHIVTAHRATLGLLVDHPDVSLRVPYGPLTVGTLRPRAGRAPGAVVPAERSAVLRAEADHHIVEVSTPAVEALALGLGYSPGWRAELDGRAVPTSATADGRLALDLPAGTHLVELRFEEGVAGPVGRAVSALTLVVLAVDVVHRRGSREPLSGARAR